MSLDLPTLYACLLGSGPGQRGFDDRCAGQRTALDRFATDNDQMAYELGHQVAHAMMMSRGQTSAARSNLLARVEMLDRLFAPDMPARRRAGEIL